MPPGVKWEPTQEFQALSPSLLASRVSQAHGSCWPGQGHGPGCEHGAQKPPLSMKKWQSKARFRLARLD